MLRSLPRKSMKKQKIAQFSLLILVVLILVGILLMNVYTFYQQSSPPPLGELPPDSTVNIEISDEEWDKLFSGETSFDDLLSGGSVSLPSEEDASTTLPEQPEDLPATEGETPSASTGEGTASSSTEAKPNGAASSSVATKPNGSTVSSGAASSGTSNKPSGSTSSGASSKPSGSASSSQKQPEPYEAEVKALILQLYSVKARAEGGLNSCIAEAKAEFKALPEAQQTQSKKLSIVFSKSKRLYDLQASCDKEVEAIVSQMRKVLTENGQSTALADQAMASYQSQKSAMYSSLMAKLYS